MNIEKLTRQVAQLRESGPMDAELTPLSMVVGVLASRWGIEENEAARLVVEELRDSPDGLPLYRRFAASRPRLLCSLRVPIPEEELSSQFSSETFYRSERDRALNNLPVALLLGARLGEPGTGAASAASLALVAFDAFNYFGWVQRPALTPPVFPLTEKSKPGPAHFDEAFRMRHKLKKLETEIAESAGRSRAAISQWIGPKQGYKSNNFGQLGWQPSPELMIECGLKPLTNASHS